MNAASAPACGFRALDIPDVLLVQRAVARDRRGELEELYRRSAFAAGGVTAAFVQDTLTHSGRRALRGLHYQRAPRTQGKLVVPLRGTIFDVAVDLRPGSPTYAGWVSVVLAADDRRGVYVPPGFAHGFFVLSDAADVLYKMTAEYDPRAQGGVRWDDPELAIPWPAPDPIVSERDAALPRLRDVRDVAAGEGSR